MASHFYCLLSKEEAEDPTKVGYAYALSKEEEWIQNDDCGDFLAPGYNIGNDFIVKDNKPYFIKKTYCDISNSRYIYLGVESTNGCDTKVFS